MSEAFFGVSEAFFGVSEAFFGVSEAFFGVSEASFGVSEAFFRLWCRLLRQSGATGKGETGRATPASKDVAV
ncbi:MAG: hypothetical protein SFV15_23715 [Polyangiaceae bacterium]|nr:hypothetical protein [Polyangiaceae bacterium]